VLFRVFPFEPGAEATVEGGALFVPRGYQGSNRHDNPDRYGALYASRLSLSAVAERLQAFRGRTLADEDLVSARGRRYALATIDDSGAAPLVDLDDPQELIRLDRRPSAIATRHRQITQPVALAIFEEGAPGLSWWSALEASWTNVTLFAERAVPRLHVVEQPEPLSIASQVVREAAEFLGLARYAP
jgi:hypothetical protein